MTNQLAVYENMNALQTAASALHQSGFFKDVASQAQAMVKVMAGAELGLPPFASMSGIHIVQGKPVLGANLIATLVKNSGRYDYRIKTLDNRACVLEWYENGKRAGEAGFTMDEANAAGLTNKPTWKAYASDMLFARAISRGARRFAPGIFGGAPVYTPDEMGVDTDEDGHIISGEIVNVTPPAPAPAAPPVDALLYEDGSFVADHPKTREVYHAYVEAHDGRAPKNRHNLKAWHEKQQANGQPQDAEQPALVATPIEGNGAYEE